MEGRDLGGLPGSMCGKELVDVGRKMEGSDLSVELELVGALGVAGERVAVVRHVPHADRATAVGRRVAGHKVLPKPRAPRQCLCAGMH